VTGAKYTVLYPITVGASITVGEFSHDMTDSDEHARGKIGVTQFSQMTAVTHYGWACVRGQTKYLTATTNTLWTAGVSLVISTTDNRLNNGARIATTSMVRDKVGISLEENGISTGGLTTGTTISIMLDGIGYGA